MITEKQAINLGMAMHLLFNSLYAGKDSDDTISWQSGGGDNHITIGYSFEKNGLTINYVAINGKIEPNLQLVLQNMINGLTVDGVLNLAQCHGLKSSGYHPITKKNVERHEKQIQATNSTFYLYDKRMELSMKLYSQFLSEYTGSIADVEDDREKFASVAIKTADVLLDKLKSQEL